LCQFSLCCCVHQNTPAHGFLGPIIAVSGGTPRPARRFARTFQYVPMRDGVRIAVTSTTPARLEEAQRVPAVLRIARYWRRRDEWPASSGSLPAAAAFSPIRMARAPEVRPPGRVRHGRGVDARPAPRRLHDEEPPRGRRGRRGQIGPLERSASRDVTPASA